MLLSSGNSPDTRCSFKLPEVRTNERVSSRNLPSQEELDPPILGERAPNFSIRDYVFASRHQGIEVSWPFAPQFLKFCLKHGVKELLPPFEHPDILRVNCLRKLEAVTQPTVGLEAETVSSNLDIIAPIIDDQSDEDPSSVPKDSGLTLKEPVLAPSIHLSSKETKSTSNFGLFVNELSHSDAGIPSTSGTSQQTEEISSQIGNPLSVSLDKSTTTQSQCEVSDPTRALEKLCEPLAKRNRLIVKLASASETRQTEDAVKNSGIILHPMASKVCPVCKTFSFTSNTTLNAHIDQCLSMESNSKGVQNNVSIYKVKPNKKRLMVDIYASSHCCTLEDLDKRNGTNWSSEMAIMTMPTNGVDVLTKRQVSPIHSEYDRTEPVYVDSHGIKLRILSKLNEQEVSHEKFKLRKQAKESKASEALSINKKKKFASKYMKVKAQNEKCFSSNFTKSQIHVTDKLDCNTESHQKNGKSPTHVSKPEEREKIIPFATVKQWARAKRSQVRKKLAIEDNCGTSGDMVPSYMNVQPDSGNSFSRSAEELTGSSKTKKVNFLNEACSMNQEHGSTELPQPNSIHSEDLTTTNSLVLKLSRSSGSFTCSSVLKLKDKDVGIWERFNSASNRKTVMLKAQRSSASKDNDTTKWQLCKEGRKVGAIEKPSISKKLCKYRTLSRSVPKGELPALSNAGSSSAAGYDSLLRVDGKETIGSNQFSARRNNTMFGKGSMNDVIARHPNIIEYQENNNSTNLSSQTQSHGTEIETSGMQMEILESRDDTTKSSMEKTTVPVVHDSVNSEKAAPPLGAELDSCQSEELASEAHIEQFKQHFKYQEKFQGDSNFNEIGYQQIKLAEVRGRKDSHLMQPGQDQADTLSLHESSGCLTCHNDELERSSSINSIRITANHSKNVSDREPSGSPISTESTISLPSLSDFKFQDAEKLSRATSVNDYQISVVPSAKSIEVAQERNLENIEHETKDNMPDKELHQCEDANCLCGSCREKIDKDSILFRENGADRTTTSKLVSDLSIGPRNSSCFTLYQNRNDNMINNSEIGPPQKLTLLNSSPDLSVNFPTRSNTCSPRPSLQSQNHSVSSPMLRLMGKNLLVQNCEEVVQSQPAFNSTQQVNLSGSEYELTYRHTKQGNFQYQHNHLVTRPPPTLCQTVPPVDHQIPLNLPRRPIGGGFTWAPVQPGCTANLNQQIQQWQLRKDPHLSYQIMDQVIVIDDPWHENDARGFITSSASNFPPPNSVDPFLPHTSFSCYPLQNKMVEHVRPLFPNIYSSASASASANANASANASASFTSQKITSENQGPFMPSPTLFQSLPGQRAPVTYYSRNLHWS
ncbi:uncharacterized protein LOC121990113 [Zingiber officinale]|uniref:UBZ4-type domain-containing protein n=1 Tax=Zingiber officinale TaxID=94328 RepID=A0A8J5I712_ZINOF|nr:uncharacterized protein LOC121990113 [Zingiber officinale]XP_042400277.1 uncharacterized protein LOC121990113 [Zingiber officinale]KAG6534816.1 hypothetical protein ZIOFF_008720 [Zingiber officinale]